MGEPIFIGEMSLANEGGFAVSLAFDWKDGDEWVQTGGTSPPFTISQTVVASPGSQGVSNAAPVRMCAIVSAGTSNTAPFVFTYQSGSLAVASYFIGGTANNNFLGLLSVSGDIANQSLGDIGTMSLRNAGGFDVKLQFAYSTNNGGHWSQPKGTGWFPLGRTETADPGDYDVPDKALVRLHAGIAGGPDQNAGQVFKYVKNSATVANYVVAGTTTKSYVGLIGITATQSEAKSAAAD